MEHSEASQASAASFTSLLMEAQSRLVLPQKMVNQEFLTTHFTNNLYNSIIDGYKESQHGVRNDLLEHLTSLTRSVTQVLQNLHSRIAPSKLPEQFRFPLERENNQDRTRLSRSIVEHLSARLVKSIGACSHLYAQNCRVYFMAIKLCFLIFWMQILQ